MGPSPGKATLVLVEVEAGGRTGLDYTYSSAAVVGVIGTTLGPVIVHRNVFAIHT